LELDIYLLFNVAFIFSADVVLGNKLFSRHNIYNRPRDRIQLVVIKLVFIMESSPRVNYLIPPFLPDHPSYVKRGCVLRKLILNLWLSQRYWRSTEII